MNKNTYTSSTECKKKKFVKQKDTKKIKKNPMLQTKFLFVKKKKLNIYFFSVLNREHQAKQYDVCNSIVDRLIKKNYYS